MKYSSLSVEQTQLKLQSLPNWQTSLANLITCPKQLGKILNLDVTWIDQALKASQLFPLRTTHEFVSRIQMDNPNDPLLKQLLPVKDEFHTHEKFNKDPLDEANATKIPGLLQKYHGRVLITLSGACAIHCRYCFRRHFPYDENTPGKFGWQKIFDYIANDSSIHEVILSGGDPLVLKDNYLKAFTDGIAGISHIKRFRIHTRIPIVLPQRVTDDHIGWLTSLPWQTTLVIHCNHANEIDSYVASALNLMRDKRITLLNQAVLLNGINDDPDTLINLSEKLFKNGVLPYYLHLLDKVEGAMHFDVNLERAKLIMQQVSKQLPGYLVPKLVMEKAGESAKVPVI